MLVACADMTGPSVPDISGEWVSLELGNEGDCAQWGSFFFVQKGGTFTGTAARFATNCLPLSSAYILDGRVSDTSISFTLGPCRYNGSFHAGHDSLSGVASCGVPDTWYASRVGPAASLALALEQTHRHLVVGGTTPLRAVLRDAAGHVLYGRSAAWSSDNPAAVAALRVDADSVLLQAVAPGSTTVTATFGGLTASAGFTARLVSFASLSAGGAHTCGVSANGDAYCWGSNSWGELGDSSITPSAAPIGVIGGLTFASISSGAEGFACGLTDAGQAYCWGNAAGNGSTLQSHAPIAISGGLTFAAMSTGGAHACALTAAGAAYCWGYDTAGQLGDGTYTTSSVPVAVAGGLTFASVSAGEEHTCGVTTSGGAYCWGDNSTGQVGDGTTANRPVPTPVSGALIFASVAAGGVHTCGLTTSGTAYCWGSDASGQLGDASQDSTRVSPSPVAVSGGLAFTSLSVGAAHACGRTSAGLVYCWGSNTAGQLGNGTTMRRQPTPVALSGGLTFASVTAGGTHTCGLTTGGAYCWGGNYFGQLGIGSIDQGRSTPIRVIGQP